MFGIDDIALGGILGGIGQAAGGIGGLFGGSKGGPDWTSIQLMREQAQMQKEFAQNGIRWKVADAKAAGLHPLAAIGAAGASYSPVAYAGDRGGSSADVGSSLAAMGQGLGRAVAATGSKEDRAAMTHLQITRQQEIEYNGLRNDLIRSQIAASNQRLATSQIGPPMPTGAGPLASAVGVYEAKPPEVLNPQPTNAGAEAGPSGPGIRYITMPGGPVVGVPARDLNIDEITSPGGPSWQYWNTLAPLVNSDLRRAQEPPAHMLPKGTHKWEWTPWGYVPVNYWRDHPKRPGADLWYGPRASTRPMSPSGAERE